VVRRRCGVEVTQGSDGGAPPASAPRFPSQPGAGVQRGVAPVGGACGAAADAAGRNGRACHPCAAPARHGCCSWGRLAGPTAVLKIWAARQRGPVLSYPGASGVCLRAVVCGVAFVAG